MYFISEIRIAPEREIGQSDDLDITAVGVLQRISLIMRSLGITNVIHLSKDGYPVYRDDHEMEDDLTQALISFGNQTDSDQRREFKNMRIGLEHGKGLLRYLIEISVSQMFRPGDYPIVRAIA